MDLRTEKCIEDFRLDLHRDTFTYVVLLLQVLGQVGTHQHTSLGGVGTEVGLAALSAGRGHR